MKYTEREALTVPEAATSAGVSRDVIYDAIGRGDLTYIIAGGGMYLLPARFAAWARARRLVGPSGEPIARQNSAASGAGEALYLVP